MNVLFQPGLFRPADEFIQERLVKVDGNDLAPREFGQIESLHARAAADIEDFGPRGQVCDSRVGSRRGSRITGAFATQVGV